MTDSAIQGAMPFPNLELRDDMGRLVGVTWHGAGASDGAGRAGWLAAVDGSPCSLRALAMVANRVTPEPGAEVDVVHVQSWLNKESAETELAPRGWTATAGARQLLDAASVRWRLHVVMGDAAEQIVNMADALGSRGITIGSQGLTAAQSLLLGSVTLQVVHQAKAPVLIVR